jgi:hypothetical protein
MSETMESRCSFIMPSAVVLAAAPAYSFVMAGCMEKCAMMASWVLKYELEMLRSIVGTAAPISYERVSARMDHMNSCFAGIVHQSSSSSGGRRRISRQQTMACRSVVP